MTDLINRPKYSNLTIGDIVKCSKAVHGSHGRRYKFLGAIFDPSDDKTPLYLDLVDIRSGGARSVRPEYVIKDIAASKAAQARIAKAAAAEEARIEAIRRSKAAS